MDTEFTTLYCKYKNPIFSYVFYLCSDRTAAEEICQEVFLKVYLNISKFEGRSSFKTWIYKIARNTCYDFIRNPNNITGSGTEIIDEGIKNPDPNPEECIIIKEKNELIKKTLKALSCKHRNYIILRDIQGFSYKEISEITGEKLNSVKTGIYRARRGFIKIFTEMEGREVGL
ncbi:MAG TPA: RNA polymerase sigma factor [Thermoanaerobacterales bacterium]|nr:RNA polymerase sigma factor [Thermoanaerobacterales bacterium]